MNEGPQMEAKSSSFLLLLQSQDVEKEIFINSYALGAFIFLTSLSKVFPVLNNRVPRDYR